MNKIIEDSHLTIDQTVRGAVDKHGHHAEAVIPILQELQKQFRYLPQEALQKVCEITEITPADIHGVSTFYDQFRHRPVGKHIISVCHGTACHVKGAGLITDAVKRHLKIIEGEDTSQDGIFTVQEVACLGCCTLAPAVQIDDITYGYLVPEQIPGMLDNFIELKNQSKAEKKIKPVHNQKNGSGELRIGLGSCCVSRGSGRLHDALQDGVKRMGIDVHIKQVGCVGMCHQTPLLEVITPDAEASLYSKVQPEDAKEILRRHFQPQSLFKRIKNRITSVLDTVLIGEDQQPVENRFIHPRDEPVAAFLNKQNRIATALSGELDPLSLDEYKLHNGFAALKHAVHHLQPQEIIEQITASGLRGRGGGGFPTGIKWSKVKQIPGEHPYIICNGDEGDPGAFMDRMLMESYPYRVIEGMAIAAYAIHARKGYFYIRAEYPLAVERIREAVKRCQEQGILGKHIFDSDFSLDLEVREGAGAFVCGEETALLASIEGKRGMPSIRPPYPAESGLHDKPTLINNVETYALVPAIIRDGAESFAKIGTEFSKGTKVFALAGKIVRGGLIEVPMGISLREVVEEIGGGVPKGRRFKAVQIGGPSGGCIPAELADVPIDYESLSELGAIMGSGGLVVLDDEDCMVDMARYFMEFTKNQSCGKCTFCRIGTVRMLDILEKICDGKAKKEDLEHLKSLAASTKQGSLCGLGKTAPNPVLTTLQYFYDEYEAHLQGRCPAGKCKNLYSLKVTSACTGCTICAQRCPVDAIELRPYQQQEIDNSKCVRCGTCINVCPVHAIRKA